MNILQKKKYYLPIETKYWKNPSLHILLQEKALQKQTKKQADALKSLKLSNKIDELNQIKNMF